MSTGLARPIPVTVPADVVSLHRWVLGVTLEEIDQANRDREAGIFGPMVGGPLPAGSETVTFPAHSGERALLHCVARFEGKAMYWTPPMTVTDGDTVTMPLPIDGYLT